MNLRDEYVKETSDDFLCKENGNSYCEWLEKRDEEREKLLQQEREENKRLVEDQHHAINLYNQEREAKRELLEGLKDLLEDSMSYYNLFPNSHRQSKEDYFSEEIYLIDKYK